MANVESLVVQVGRLTVLQHEYEDAEIQTSLPLEGLIGFLNSIIKTKPGLAASLAVLERDMEVLELTFRPPEDAQEHIAKHERDEQDFEKMRSNFRDTHDELDARLVEIEKSMPENERSAFPYSATKMREANDAAAAEIDALLVALVEKNSKLRKGYEELVCMWSKDDDEDEYNFSELESNGSVSGDVTKEARDEGSKDSTGDEVAKEDLDEGGQDSTSSEVEKEAQDEGRKDSTSGEIQKVDQSPRDR
ncbi:hypothetical protein VTJ83DRAFT_155 [Remersonia thermophila]|uniref:Uncharacterized protein n=1 Tax=Remersonia thermophila TaxID=72144 RepID=A0ABR4DL79_9PEZI